MSTNKTIEEITKEIEMNQATLFDTSAYLISDYIKCEGETAENIGGRIRAAFIRCPKCQKFISVYRDEISGDITKPKRCMCGLIKTYELKNYVNNNI